MTLTRLLCVASPLLPILGLLGAVSGADAATLTTSYSAWQAGVAGLPVTSTSNTGLFDPFALNLPTTTSIPLADGNVLQLGTTAQVTQPQNGYPYLLPDGSTPDLFIPVDSNGNQLKTETLTIPSSLSALGFSFVPFSSSQNGPYSFSIQLSDGETASASLPGGNLNTGTTVPGFVGFFGGGITSLTITTSDPNGLAFGAFVDVPEPATALLLVGPAVAVARRRRRGRACAAA